ncbi:VWA domain-containing protein [Nitriliruptor alkaliphilus]|uniref:VWA domain-containing protein n=1 Tax=Nitriliruptor alkaliphilus TaxID=427918 RepID=UPI0006967229|nr:VWA domain-containing protein [Nitriliruptor alkaliphilus]
MPLAFGAPLALLALPVAAIVVLLTRRRSRVDRHLRTATFLRAAGVTALVLALAQPTWNAAGGDLDLVVLVDASDSTSASQAAVTAWLDGAVAARGGNDRMAVAAVGRDAQVEHALRVDPPGGRLQVRVDGSETDLARGLRLAQGLAGSEHRRRVVLLTDGLETRGDAASAVTELRAAGIALDVVRLGDGAGADVLVAGVDAPSRVRAGEAYEVVVTLVNTGAPAGGELVLLGDGDLIERRAVELDTGTTEIRFERVAPSDDEVDAAGTVRYEARLESAASTEPRNDIGVAAVQVAGPARVLLVEGTAGDADELARLLEAGGLPTTVRPPQDGFPRLDDLLEHDAAVLVDVDESQIGEAGAVALDAYVRDAGRGLTVVGGERSYGPGGYDGTRLEELLPVFARIEDPQRRPSVAQALVVDVSGSMAACHCRPAFEGGEPQMIEGGVNKTDISREAVARAIANLDQQDTVGVLAFHTRAEWVLPLQSLPDQSVVDDALARLHPQGDTRISTALEEAIEGLKDVEARLRHIVLFTDGFTNERGLVAVTERAAEAGITVSVVGTGEGTDDVLEEMANAGGGRFYPGRDLASIPSVLASEVQMVARPLIEEGEFPPIVTAADPIVDRLDAAPPLLGYVATTEKPTARTLLRIGDERDPLLVTWQAGLGEVVAWTSDAVPRWSSHWAGWEGARDLWSSVVRSTLPTDDGGGFDVSASVTPDGLRIEVTASEPLPADTVVTATVTGPDGERRQVPVPREDLDTFAATVAAGGEGVHAVTVAVERAGAEPARRTVTATRTYPAEYALHPGGAEAAAVLATIGEGELDVTPEQAFRRDGTEPGRRPRDLVPWLLLIALLTIPADVGARRLRLERGDLAAFLRLPRRRERAGAPLPPATAAPRAAPSAPPPPTTEVPAAGPATPVGADGAHVPGQPTQPPPPVAPPPPPTGAAALLASRRRAREGATDPPPDEGP